MKQCCLLKKNTKYGSFEMTCICGATLFFQMQRQLIGLIWKIQAVSCLDHLVGKSVHHNEAMFIWQEVEKLLSGKVKWGQMRRK